MTRRKSWRGVAETLADRLYHSADVANCGHRDELEPECAWCKDRAAYQVYLERRAQEVPRE